MLRIIHIEDERDVRELFRGIIAKFLPDTTELISAETFQQGRELIEKEAFDLLFLDLQLENKCGMDLLVEFPSIAKKTILCTADISRGVEALNKGIFYYLVKPINIQEVIDVVNKFIKKQPKDDQQELLANSTVSCLNGRLMVHDNNGFEVINVDDIIRLESIQSYTQIYVQSGYKILSSRHLKIFEDKLEKYNFIRIHRAHLINATFIKRVNKSKGGKGSVELSNGEEIGVSISGQRELNTKFNL